MRFRSASSSEIESYSSTGFTLLTRRDGIMPVVEVFDVDIRLLGTGRCETNISGVGSKGRGSA